MSKYLQSEEIHIKLAGNLCKKTVNKIKQSRTKESFDAFWNETVEFSCSNVVDKSSLPRKRAVTRKHIDNLPTIINFKTVEEMFETHFYELIDIVIFELNRRFMT